MRLMVVLLLASAAGACGAPNVVSVPVWEPLVVPEDLRACPLGPYLPAEPPTPRTLKQVFDWAQSTSGAAVQNQLALVACQHRLARLNDFLTIYNQHMAATARAVR